jgi:predicted nucleotidyltransferase
MEDDVKAIILKSIEDYNYSEIILFGSRAKNKYSEDSDYDLLLIMNNPLSILEMRKMQVEIRKKLALQGIDADVIVKSRKIIDEYKTKKGNIIYNALREGVTL